MTTTNNSLNYTFDQYNSDTDFTRKLGNPITSCYAFLGLLGETGEVAERLNVDLYPENETDGSHTLRDYLQAAERIKKQARSGDIELPNLYVKDLEALKKELGDVLWYLNTLANTVGLSLEEIAYANVAKLQDRHNSPA